MKKVKQALAQAKKHNDAMFVQCGLIAEALQPYFDKEIGVLFQESDGFCVVEDSDNQREAPYNYPVEEVVKNIGISKNYYKDQ